MAFSENGTGGTNLSERKFRQYRIRFGRFLAFSENYTTGIILTERRFRGYWEHSEGADERRRFRHVVEMIEAETNKVDVPNPNALMIAIRERYSDSKWHPAPCRQATRTCHREREKLRQAYGDSRTSAGARFEQELAKLYSRTGWTQEKIAGKEVKSPQHIARWLRFGRFMAFAENSPSGRIFENLPNNLTERRFRSYWERVPDIYAGNERQRFAAVAKLMAEELGLVPPKTKSVAASSSAKRRPRFIRSVPKTSIGANRQPPAFPLLSTPLGAASVPFSAIFGTLARHLPLSYRKPERSRQVMPAPRNIGPGASYYAHGYNLPARQRGPFSARHIKQLKLRGFLDGP